jgi:hypothetical protein
MNTNRGIKLKKIGAGVYEAGEYIIKRFSLSYLMDNALTGVQWDVYDSRIPESKRISLFSARTLADCVWWVNQP